MTIMTLEKQMASFEKLARERFDKNFAKQPIDETTLRFYQGRIELTVHYTNSQGQKLGHVYWPDTDFGIVPIVDLILIDLDTGAMLAVGDSEGHSVPVAGIKVANYWRTKWLGESGLAEHGHFHMLTHLPSRTYDHVCVIVYSNPVQKVIIERSYDGGLRLVYDNSEAKVGRTILHGLQAGHIVCQILHGHHVVQFCGNTDYATGKAKKQYVVAGSINTLNM